MRLIAFLCCHRNLWSQIFCDLNFATQDSFTVFKGVGWGEDGLGIVLFLVYDSNSQNSLLFKSQNFVKILSSVSATITLLICNFAFANKMNF